MPFSARSQFECNRKKSANSLMYPFITVAEFSPPSGSPQIGGRDFFVKLIGKVSVLFQRTVQFCLTQTLSEERGPGNVY